MYNFLDSNLFQTLIAFFVWLIAIFIYYKQKRDFKSDIAKLIYLEISPIWNRMLVNYLY
jgi:hypothetical protein